jgi:hypothetical protein
MIEMNLDLKGSLVLNQGRLIDLTEVSCFEN